MHPWKQVNALHPLSSLAHMTRAAKSRRANGRSVAVRRSCIALPLVDPFTESSSLRPIVSHLSVQRS